MKKLAIALLLVLAAATSSSGQITDSILVGSVHRIYYLHLPSGYAGGTGLVPLVIGLHGANQEPVAGPLSFSRMTGFDAKADTEGFIVVYPEGTSARQGGRALTWNGGGCCPPATILQADDISFIAALIDTLSSRYRVDTRRVYATGISNGGILSYRLGCELAGRITAIAPVEAAYMVTGPCAPIRGVPALHIHSLQDSAIPYQGGPGVLSPGFSFPSVDSTIAAWRRAIGCTGEAETIASSALYTARRWSSCSGDAVVELYATSDGGHSWPGAGAMASAAFDATDVIWEFFSRFAMAPSSSVEDGSAGGELITVSPNPSHADAVATVMLERGAHVTLDLFDPLGRFVASLVDADLTDGAHAVSLPTLPRGAYLLRARIGGSVHTRGFVRE